VGILSRDEISLTRAGGGGVGGWVWQKKTSGLSSRPVSVARRRTSNFGLMFASTVAKTPTGLSLDNNQLTSAKGLEKLTQLTWLWLRDNPDLTKAQIDELQKALPKCNILSDFN